MSDTGADRLRIACTWLGYRLTLAVPDRGWIERLEAFTGLAMTEDAAAGTAPPVLAVAGPREAVVDGADVRTFASAADLEAWLLLTVSDVMVARGRFATIHAAAVLAAEGAVLLAGPPYAGKSTLAAAARDRGLVVLGDDQVRVDPDTGWVWPLPRPAKRRVEDAPAAAPPAAGALRARLDDELVDLAPRRGLASVDEGHRVARIVHLARHAGPGIRVATLEPFAATRGLLDQARVPGGDGIVTAAAIARRLGRVPALAMSVGDGEIGRALQAVASPVS
ncbi:MAG: HPr Serine kinase C-terminal domain [Planctomycetota bacterium]